MEERLTSAAAHDNYAGQLAQLLSDRHLAERRQQALELVTAENEALSRLEQALDEQLAELETQIVASLAERDDATRADLEQFAATLRAEAEEVTRQQAELVADRAEIATRHAELQLAREQLAAQHAAHAQETRHEREALDRRAAELDAQTAKLKQQQRTLTTAQEEQHAEIEQLTRRRARLDEQQTRLEQEGEELEQRREETRNQRRRIAQQFKMERAAVAQERAQVRDEADRLMALQGEGAQRAAAQLRAEREAFEQEMERTRQQLRREKDHHAEELAALDAERKKLDELRRAAQQSSSDEVSQLLARVHELETQLAAATSEVATAHELLTEAQGQLHAAEAELQATRDEMAAAREESKSASVTSGGMNAEDMQKLADMQRRFELAVDDVRQLKRKNSELEEELSGYRAVNARRTSGEGKPSHGTDWETTKRRLLAELEGEDGEPAKLCPNDRLTVEGAIRITDDIVSQREQEIADLKQLLTQQSSNLGDVAVGATAVTQALDMDEMIRQERERLVALQQEWRDKLKQAEIDLSVERARVGRERVELEEKLRMLDEEKAHLATQLAAGEIPGDKSKKTRRWLERLGIKDGEK